MITLASLFDGISGFPLAGQRNGIVSLWASEIEPFPMKVSAIRYPDMVQHGDVTKINGADVEPVDIITGGSPCQDLSVAGKRAGLAGERSGLFMEQIRIVREMRNADKLRLANAVGSGMGERGATNIEKSITQHRFCSTNKYIRPRFMVWENVPGAFSSNKGEDFRAVLEETARIAEKTVVIPRPPKGKWNTVGCIMGNSWSIAWRILDAQYWGVPQRRRRIFLVADFGGQSAPEVLFKREGLRRHIAESREARQGIAADAERGVEKASTFDFGRTSDRIEINPSVSVTIKGTGGGGGAKTGLYCIPINDKATRHMGGGQSRNHDGSGNGLGIGKPGDPCPTLTVRDKHAVCAGFKAEQSADARSIGYQEQCSPTLPAEGATPCVITCASKQYSQNIGYNVAAPLCAEDYKEPQVVAQINCQPSGISGTVSSKWAKGTGGPAGDEHYNLVIDEVARPLSAQPQMRHRLDMDNVVCSVDCRNMYENPEKSATLQSKPNGGQSLNYQNPVRVGYSVRRLTPLECERLQDYPDGWTDIPGASDSGRYKAAGNSVAVCCPEYVLEGIREVLA
jgi:DNA (cytosine-5)-methyltransferase 1